MGFEPTTPGSEVSQQFCLLLPLKLIYCFVSILVLATKTSLLHLVCISISANSHHTFIFNLSFLEAISAILRPISFVFSGAQISPVFFDDLPVDIKMIFEDLLRLRTSLFLMLFIYFSFKRFMKNCGFIFASK